MSSRRSSTSGIKHFGDDGCGVEVPRKCFRILRLPPNERNQQEVHELTVLFTEQLRVFNNRLAYGDTFGACRGFRLETVNKHHRMRDEADDGSAVFRVMLKGKVLIERRMANTKVWLHAGFVSVGDTLGIPVMQADKPDLSVMYTVSEEAHLRPAPRVRGPACAAVASAVSSDRPSAAAAGDVRGASPL
jgi:hypothetical protein